MKQLMYRVNSYSSNHKRYFTTEREARAWHASAVGGLHEPDVDAVHVDPTKLEKLYSNCYKLTTE